MKTNPQSGKILPEQRRDVYLVDPKAIIDNSEFNLRNDYGDIESLARSIEEHGVKMPLQGYRDKDDHRMIHLTDGFRRMMAVKKLLEKGVPIKQVPVKLEPRGYKDESRVLDMLVLGEGAKPLTPTEKAEGIARLINSYGWSVSDVASKLSCSDQQVRNYLATNDLPKLLKNKINSNSISVTYCLELYKKSGSDTDKVLEMISKTENSSANKRATKRSVQKTENQVNSFREMKKFVSETDVQNVREEKRAEFEAMQGIILNTLSAEDIRARYLSQTFIPTPV